VCLKYKGHDIIIYKSPNNEAYIIIGCGLICQKLIQNDKILLLLLKGWYIGVDTKK